MRGQNGQSEYISLISHHITKADVRNVGYCIIDFEISRFVQIVARLRGAESDYHLIPDLSRDVIAECIRQLEDFDD